MSTMIEDIKQTTEQIIEARKKLAEAKEQTIGHKENLKDRETILIIKGLRGKNQAERDAFLRSDTIDERMELERAEKCERVASLELEIAKDKRQCLEDLIKIAGMND